MVGLEKIHPKSIESDNIRSFEVADGEVIKLEGITDKQWAIYEPLLNALRATRIQTESGGVEITPMPYQEVKKYFPENPTWQHIKRHHKMLSNALAPSGWFIDRKGQWSKKPIGAPWFLRGPDDGVQNKTQPIPQQKNIYSRTLGDERRRLALEQFNPLDFGTKLLRSCLSNLTNPDVKRNFTTDLEQFMSSCLPADLKLKDILGNKTPQDCFQEIITDAISSMVGKRPQDLSEIQQKILPMWNQLKIESGMHPKTVMFEHFGIQPTSSPAPESPTNTTRF